MDEQQNKPASAAPAIQQSPAVPPSGQTKNMEVHHHGHVHEKSKWKEYVFQFIMLFLAVFLGFFAENLRERNAERNNEKEYIESLVTDIETDRAMIQLAASSIVAQVRGIDSLQILFSQPDLKNNTQVVYDCYRYSDYLQIAYFVNFNQRTITQLLSSGNMRLLKTKHAADTVTGYFNLVKNSDSQKQMYLEQINKCTESMFNVYDIYYLRKVLNDQDMLVFAQNDWSAIQLLTTDRLAINKFLALLEVTKLMILGYKGYLDIIDVRAEQTLTFLKAEYHLD